MVPENICTAELCLLWGGRDIWGRGERGSQIIFSREEVRAAMQCCFYVNTTKVIIDTEIYINVFRFYILQTVDSEELEGDRVTPFSSFVQFC